MDKVAKATVGSKCEHCGTDVYVISAGLWVHTAMTDLEKELVEKLAIEEQRPFHGATQDIADMPIEVARKRVEVMFMPIIRFYTNALVETWLAVNLERIKAESYENGMQAGAKEEALLQRIFDEPGPIKDEIERIKAEARLEEAKWWIGHLESNGDEVLDSDRERLTSLVTAALEAQAKKEKP